MKEKKRFLSFAFGIVLLLSVIIAQLPGIATADAAASAVKTQTGNTQIASGQTASIQYIGQIVNCKKSIRVYKSARTSSRSLGSAKKGATYVVNTNYVNKSWYQISFNGKVGYVKKYYVKLTQNIVAAPAVSAAPAPVVSAAPAPVITPAPVSTPAPVVSATPAPVASAAPAPVSTPAPAASATPAPETVVAADPALDTNATSTDLVYTLPVVSIIPVTADTTWYTIDNAQFGIDSTGNSARATTDGINNALAWAKTQGYNKIKFVEGTYLIQCNWNNRYIAPTDGILVPSGMTLDLGNSTFQLEANSYPAYSIFSVVNQSNVTIKGGTLIGDLGQHVYAASSDSSTHEWGFGICISASSNVTIQDVTIKNVTGDGIIIEGSYESLANGGRVSSNVRLLDNDISNCRRQGISVIGSTDSEIAGNKIYNISGTDPQYGIDVETEFDYNVNGLKIHNNTIYDCSGGSINANKGSDYEIYANTCTNGNILAAKSSNVRIYGNTINNGFIRVMTGTTNVTATDNILDAASWVFFG